MSTMKVLQTSLVLTFLTLDICFGQHFNNPYIPLSSPRTNYQPQVQPQPQQRTNSYQPVYQQPTYNNQQPNQINNPYNAVAQQPSQGNSNIRSIPGQNVAQSSSQNKMGSSNMAGPTAGKSSSPVKGMMGGDVKGMCGTCDQTLVCTILKLL